MCGKLETTSLCVFYSNDALLGFLKSANITSFVVSTAHVSCYFIFYKPLCL